MTLLHKNIVISSLKDTVGLCLILCLVFEKCLYAYKTINATDAIELMWKGRYAYKRYAYKTNSVINARDAIELMWKGRYAYKRYAY